VSSERQIRCLGRPGDVLIVISTSGRSPNILRAIGGARQQGLRVVGFTGRTGGEMAPLCDLCLRAPADETQLVEQLHNTAGHIICGLVEKALASLSRWKCIIDGSSAPANARLRDHLCE
jgi:D-sedoheptulose 7-phosphate isomerase